MKHYFLLLLLIGCIASGRAESGWKAHWINTERCQSATNTWLAFRKTVHIDKVPQTLTARIAADSKYWLWINGRLVVFEGGLKRGPSPDDTYYDPVEIASYLQNGENTIAVLVWHFGKSGFSHVNSGLAALLFEAVAPGIEIVSDKSWQCTVYDAYQNTGAPYPNYRLPESNIRFDARMEMSGWNQPGYTGKMPNAEVISPVGGVPLGKLVERPIPLWKDYGLKPYVSVRRSAAGDTLYCRLPYNSQVTPYLKVEASAGKVIHIRTDNYEGGSQYNVRAEYVTRDGVQEYESLGWMNGHEMLYILPEGVKVLDVKFRETGYNTEFTGSFSCNDPFMNELWKRSARTLYITMRDSYMDCPDRERAQWWLSLIHSPGAPILEKAKQSGASELFALNPVILLVTIGGFITNASYCLFQNVKNGTGKDYFSVSGGTLLNNVLFCALAGVLWYSQFFGLGMGKSYFADSPVMLAFSWSILMSRNVIFSNVWGIILKEWKGVSRQTIIVPICGMCLLIFSLLLPNLI